MDIYGNGVVRGGWRAKLGAVLVAALWSQPVHAVKVLPIAPQLQLKKTRPRRLPAAHLRRTDEVARWLKNRVRTARRRIPPLRIGPRRCWITARSSYLRRETMPDSSTRNFSVGSTVRAKGLHAQAVRGGPVADNNRRGRAESLGSGYRPDVMPNQHAIIRASELLWRMAARTPFPSRIVLGWVSDDRHGEAYVRSLSPAVFTRRSKAATRNAQYHLIAHELTHILQNANAPSWSTRRPDTVETSLSDRKARRQRHWMLEGHANWVAGKFVERPCLFGLDAYEWGTKLSQRVWNRLITDDSYREQLFEALQPRHIFRSRRTRAVTQK